MLRHTSISDDPRVERWLRLRGPEERPSPRTKPIIHSVQDLTTGTEDSYTPAGRFIIRGSGFGALPEVGEDIGVFLCEECKAGQHRVERYFSWQDDEIQGEWPLGRWGVQRVFIETSASGGLILGVLHSKPLAPTHRLPPRP
jgi:hypothetical protein